MVDTFAYLTHLEIQSRHTASLAFSVGLGYSLSSQ
jgi:hypothetical protein